MIPVLHGVWAAAGLAGDFEHIETQTVGSGGAASVTFSSIASTYKHLQIRFTGLTTTNGIQPTMRVGSGSVDTGSNYTRHSLYGDGGAASSFGAATQSQLVLGGLSVGMNSTNPYVAVIDILDFASTSKNKTIRSLSGTDRNGSGEIGLHSGVWMNSSTAINIITVIASSGTFAQHSTFSLYGVK